MLDGLCGNKNIQKVLLFLFVNSKCYGTQLQRVLKSPLTSLQNALMRLEKGRIILSYTEGRTKLYQFNPSYPLLPELETLLKKAYTLLSPQEKKFFSLVQREALEKCAQEPHLWGFFERLKRVKKMTLYAKSPSHCERGWNGKGMGEVLVTKEDETTIVFHERGAWQIQQGQDMTFSNIFRWSMDKSCGMISLEHLRLGPKAPVFLFHLAPTGSNLLASVESHLCEEDAYLAQVVWDHHSIRLHWRVIGPRKNEEMEYHYF